MHKSANYEVYWLLAVDCGNEDNHVLHTFLSCNLSFPSLSPVTSLITPKNDGPALTDLALAGRNNFKTTPDFGCFKTITPTVNIIVYDSIYSNVVIDIDNYLDTYHLRSGYSYGPVPIEFWLFVRHMIT